MTVIALSGVFSPPLNGASIELAAGVNVVLATEADGSAELLALVAGTSAPRRGRVSVAGQNPRSTPAIRRRIGALLAAEELPPGLTVSAAVGLALRARGEPRSADDLLAAAGLASWGPRRTDSLSLAEERRIALALALAVADARVLALHEPLVAAGSERSRVRELLAERADAGACVLVTTASPRDADELGGTLLLLERGRFVRRPGEPLATELSPGTSPELRVRTADPRRLAAELAGDPALTRLECSAGPEGSLIAHGPHPDALALAVARAARRADVPVLGIACVLPRLEVVRAASEGLTRAALESAQRAAYEAAQRAAQPPAPPPPPPAAAPPPSSPPPPPEQAR